MSRLIVKGLPKHLTEDRLREHFAVAGEVTDARIRRTKDGRSRQFGFVGFRTKDEAENAKRMFNSTFLDTNKLNVDVALSFGDEKIPRAWSKYTKGTTRYNNLNGEDAGSLGDGRNTKVKPSLKNDGDVKDSQKSKAREKQLAEFMSAAQPRSKKYVWSNDDGSSMLASEKTAKVKSKKAGGENVYLERKHMTFDEDSESPESDQQGDDSDVATSEDNIDAPTEQDGNIARDMKVSDLEYMKQKMTSTADSEDEEESSNSGSEESDVDEESEEYSVESDKENKTANNNTYNTSKTDAEAGSALSEDVPAVGDSNGDGSEAELGEESLPKSLDDTAEAAEPVSESGRLFVRNLPYSATEEDLEELFQNFGALAEVHLCVSATTKVSKGLAYILYVVPEHAVRALAELDGTIFMGRLLHILPARPKTQKFEEPTEKESPAGGGKMSYKDEKARKLKEAAKNRSDVVAYNPLFMNADAVAGTLAERHSVEKSDILNSENAAVRIATGEAQIQEEIREVLAKEGVNVEAFSMMDKTSMKTKRSKTVILVKNLPAGTTADEIRHKFSKFGSLARLVTVPTGLIALVEFFDAADARKAYGSLAYSRFKEKPLYLEWAPLNAFKTAASDKLPVDTVDNANEVHGDSVSGKAQAGEEVTEVEEGTTSVFVKNLNFATSDEDLLKLISKKMKVRGAKIARRKMDSKSLGYGFLDFATPADALMAVKKFEGATLDGHKLELKLSQGKKRKEMDFSRAAPAAAAQSGAARSSKLLVKNLAFEASQKEVHKLFGTYGELKSVKIPKKFDGTSRGFAFVEFTSKSEAAAAMSTLKAAHFYARRLILEYAEEEQDPADTEAFLEQRMKKEEKRSRAQKRRKTDGGQGDGDGNGDEAEFEMYS